MRIVVEPWRLGFVLLGFLFGMFAGLLYDIAGKFGFMALAFIGVVIIWCGLTEWSR